MTTTEDEKLIDVSPLGVDDAYPTIFDELLADWLDLAPDVNWYCPRLVEVDGIKVWYCNLQYWGGCATVWHEDPRVCAMAAEVMMQASKQVAGWCKLVGNDA